MRLIFLLGQVNDTGLQRHLVAEHLVHADILQISGHIRDCHFYEKKDFDTKLDLMKKIY